MHSFVTIYNNYFVGTPDEFSDFEEIDLTKLAKQSKCRLKSSANKKDNKFDNDDSEEQSSEGSADETNSDSVACSSDSDYNEDNDDNDVFEILSEHQLQKVSKSIRNCIGKTFTDHDDKVEGLVISIVRHIKSKELCFKYSQRNCDVIIDQNSSNVNNNYEYIYISSLSESNATWNTITNDQKESSDQNSSSSQQQNTVEIKKRNTCGRWEYEVSPSRSIFENNELPDESKRSRNSSSIS